MRRPILLLVVFLLLGTAIAAAAGYVVILKNGHKIRCAEPLRIEGNSAIITLTTKVETSYPLDQIDLIETERYNKLGFGTALTLDEIGLKGTPIPTPTPKRSLGHYADIDPENRENMLGSNIEPSPTPTPGIKLQTSEFHDERVTQAFSRIFDEKKLYLYRTSTGTRPEYLYVQAVTDSEREVFDALRVVSEAYTIIHRLHSDLAPAAVELQMVQTSGKAAGTFRLTPDLATQIVSGNVSVQQFYVDNVIF